jgi:hypothetical protein
MEIDKDYVEEAARLRLVSRKDQQAIIALHWSVANDPEVPAEKAVPSVNDALQIGPKCAVWRAVALWAWRFARTIWGLF